MRKNEPITVENFRVLYWDMICRLSDREQKLLGEFINLRL